MWFESIFFWFLAVFYERTRRARLRARAAPEGELSVPYGAGKLRGIVFAAEPRGGEAKRLTYPKVWCLLDKVRTYYEQNPDAG